MTEVVPIFDDRWTSFTHFNNRSPWKKTGSLPTHWWRWKKKSAPVLRETPSKLEFLRKWGEMSGNIREAAAEVSTWIHSSQASLPRRTRVVTCHLQEAAWPGMRMRETEKTDRTVSSVTCSILGTLELYWIYFKDWPVSVLNIIFTLSECQFEHNRSVLTEHTIACSKGKLKFFQHETQFSRFRFGTTLQIIQAVEARI